MYRNLHTLRAHTLCKTPTDVITDLTISKSVCSTDLGQFLIISLYELVFQSSHVRSEWLRLGKFVAV